MLKQIRFAGSALLVAGLSIAVSSCNKEELQINEESAPVVTEEVIDFSEITKADELVDEEVYVDATATLDEIIAVIKKQMENCSAAYKAMLAAFVKHLEEVDSYIDDHYTLKYVITENGLKLFQWAFADEEANPTNLFLNYNHEKAKEFAFGYQNGRWVLKTLDGSWVAFWTSSASAARISKKISTLSNFEYHIAVGKNDIPYISIEGKNMSRNLDFFSRGEVTLNILDQNWSKCAGAYYEYPNKGFDPTVWYDNSVINKKIKVYESEEDTVGHFEYEADTLANPTRIYVTSVRNVLAALNQFDVNFQGDNAQKVTEALADAFNANVTDGQADTLLPARVGLGNSGLSASYITLSAEALKFKTNPNTWQAQLYATYYNENDEAVLKKQVTAASVEEFLTDFYDRIVKEHETQTSK